MYEDAALEAWSGTSALSSALQAREVSEQSPPGQPPGMGAGPRKWGGGCGAEARAGISSRPQGDLPSLHAAPHPPERQRQAPRPLTRRHTALPSVPGATLQHIPSTHGCLPVLRGVGNQLQRQRCGSCLCFEGRIIIQVGS